MGNKRKREEDDDGDGDDALGIEPRVKKVRFNIPADKDEKGQKENEKPKDIMSSLSELVDDISQNKNLLFNGSEKDIVLKKIEIKIADEEDDDDVNENDGKKEEEEAQNMNDNQENVGDEDDNFDFEAIDHDTSVDDLMKQKDASDTKGTYHDWDDVPLGSTLYPSTKSKDNVEEEEEEEGDDDDDELIDDDEEELGDDFEKMLDAELESLS